MAINLTSKYSPKIDERFKLTSITDAYAGKKYDWDGAQTVIVYSVDPVTLGNYNRSANGGRFGTVAELGDSKQTMTLSQDKAFTFSIDHGNSADQLNIKRCNEQLKSNWDEVCTPEIDTYRFRKWASGAGLSTINGTALTKSTVMEAIMLGSAAMSNKKVPKKNRALFIKESVYVFCKLSNEVVGIDTLGAKAVANGVVGYLDGMAVVPVPDSYLPDGINFIIKYKDSSVDPMKLKVLRVQKNPIGFDADVGECRFYHDSFVLDSKINGIFVHAKDGMAATPTGDNGTTASGKVTLSSTTSDAIIKYTTDGTNPKTSATASTYSAAFTSPESGSVVKAYASKSGLIDSAVFELTI